MSADLPAAGGVDELPDILNFQLRDDRDRELYVRLESAAANDLDATPDDLTRAEVFRWAAVQALDAPDCNHLPEYHLETADGVVCMRCRDESGEPTDRDLTEDLIDTPLAGGGR